MLNHIDQLSPRRRAACTAFIIVNAAIIALVGCSSEQQATQSLGPPITPADTAASVLTWVNSRAIPLLSVTPTTQTADLAALKTMIGSAPVVGFGEGSHGTAEFQTFKHRILEYLVTQDGFTGFALEAMAPQAMAIDDYVRTGRGDPVTLLSRLYEWPWNTHEMLDLVQWMRSYNATQPAATQVGFYGFDIQTNSVAMDSVLAFVHRAGSASLQTFVDQQYAIVAPYRNDTTGQSPLYLAASATDRAAVHAAVIAVHDSLVAAQGNFTIVVPDSEFQRALHLSRVVEQWERYYGSGSLNTVFRDSAMAENVVWLTQHVTSGGKLMLWAHDQHIGRFGFSMGTSLNETFGSRYVATGLTFLQGSFNARDTFNILRSHVADSVPATTVESILARAQLPSFYVDLRTASAGTPEYAYLNTFHKMRSIGAVYWDSSPQLFYVNAPIAYNYDVLVYITQSSPTTLMPYVP